MKINLRLSRPQYRAMVERMMSRQPIATQESQADSIGRSLVESTASLRDLAGAQSTVGGEPVETPAPAPQPSALPTQRPVGDLITNAQQAWAEIGPTVGGMLWARLVGGASPEQSFIDEAVRYQQDPMSVSDERIRQFMAGVFPPQEQDITQAPQTASVQGPSPMFKMIFDSLR